MGDFFFPESLGQNHECVLYMRALIYGKIQYLYLNVHG